MKCRHDRTPMIQLYSCVSADEKLLLTNWWCPSCNRREIVRHPNPVYVPIIAPEYRKENSGARTKRIVITGEAA
jgi:hypothetical protein